mgnify:CR=1 FL=1
MDREKATLKWKHAWTKQYLGTPFAAVALVAVILFAFNHWSWPKDAAGRQLHLAALFGAALSSLVTVWIARLSVSDVFREVLDAAFGADKRPPGQ